MSRAASPSTGRDAAPHASGKAATQPDFAARVPGYIALIEAALDASLAPAATHPARLHAAIRYAVLGGGKRLRPLLAYATAECLGLVPERVRPIAVAIELVHAYSLVHDDLPAMDDDELRRGRLTCHLAFDEATAILVGDALQAQAYRVLATDVGLRGVPQVQQQLILDLAAASGSAGMAGGQAMDMAATGRHLAPEDLEHLHALKTGRLLRAAVIMPCRLRPDLDGGQLASLDRFARPLGLAFQIADDLLDVEGSSDVIGKPQGSDLRNNKLTLPSLLGVDGARARLGQLRCEALDALAGLGREADGLRWICDRVVVRDR